MIDEKKEEFKLPDNVKIWCENKEYATKVQEKLFELGYKWIDGFKVWHPAVGGKYTLYARQNRLTWGYKLDFEENTKCVAYVLDETTGEIVPANKETQEDKSATEVVTNNTKTESLDSLFNQIVLLQKENDSLIEQKEQIVNKISANTQAINILKDKMQLRLNQIGNVFVGVDKADVVEEGGILDITDWQDLKIGDIVYVFGEDCVVCEVEPEDYAYDYAFAVMAEEGMLWVDVSCDNWKFVSRPK